MFSFGKISFIQKAFLLSSILLLGLTASAEDQAKASYTLCKSGGVVRTIRVQLGAKYCRAFYTKEGADQLVGKSTAPNVCFDIVNKIKANLEAGNWKCKDISQTRVSSSLE